MRLRTSRASVVLCSTSALCLGLAACGSDSGGLFNPSGDQGGSAGTEADGGAGWSGTGGAAGASGNDASAGAAGLGGASGKAGAAGTGGAAGSGGQGGCTSASQCSDGIACTVDTCSAGKCAHEPGPNTGPTACPPGQHCDVKLGCTDTIACSTPDVCVKAWAGDACKTNIRCDGAAMICKYDPLDKDKDGHPPRVCGGDDCDDADGGKYPGAKEICDGKDNDCNVTVDDGATCGGLLACQGGACVCPAANTCGNECVDKSTSPSHCGFCNNKCPSAATCQAGSCVCAPNATICSGQCVDIKTDPLNCNGCGNLCASGYSCKDGACTCLMTSCSGVCVDTKIDPAHCGSCTIACGPSQTCQAGLCKCAPGLLECGPSCVDSKTDPQNCGTCNNVCGPSQVCQASTCECTGGLLKCGPKLCVDPLNDPLNCQTCGHQCPGGGCKNGACCVVDNGACQVPGDCCNGSCIVGQCRLPTCNDGLKDGLETDVDCGGPTACKRCGTGKMCLQGSDCVSGQCPAGLCTGVATLSFGAPAAHYPSGGSSDPWSVAAADLNGDGNVDLAIADSGTTNVAGAAAVLNGNGLGGFTAGWSASTGLNTYPFHVLAVDVNGDAARDLVVTNEGTGTVSVFLGNGLGSFGTAKTTSVGSSTMPYSSAIGEFSGDTMPDLLVPIFGNGTSTAVYYYTGTGGGTYSYKASITVGAGPVHIATGDFNQDGKLDFATVNNNVDTMSVVYGLGAGSFQAGASYATGDAPRSIAAADFNGDTRPDLVVANQYASTVTVFRNSGSSFATGASYAAGTGARWVVTGDFNMDGKADIAVANYDAGTVSVLRGIGDGTFQAKADFACGANPRSLATADFNKDGRPDLVTVSDSTNAAYVMLNTSQ